MVDPDPGRGVEWTIPMDQLRAVHDPVTGAYEPLQVFVNTGADDDRLTVAYALEQILWIHSGAGNDTLTLGSGGNTEESVCGDGVRWRPGQDMLTLDAGASTAGRFFDIGQIFSPMLHDGAGRRGRAGRRLPWAASTKATRSVVRKEVEKLDVRPGSGGDIVRLDATAADVQQVLIDSGAGSDQFEVGGGDMALSDIHGQVQLDGRQQPWRLRPVVDRREQFRPRGSFPDELLTPTRLAGGGLSGLEYSGIRDSGSGTRAR